MPVVINTNIGSLTAQRNLDKSQGRLQTSLQRLSSGVRINTAKDDAAGLAIADRMTSQVRGTAVARRNAMDAVSMVQVADGAMSGLTNLVLRMRELAVQAANATNSAQDKAALQQEVGQLLGEIDRVAEQSEFNGVQLFQSTGTLSSLSAEEEAVVDGLRNGWLRESETLIQERLGLTGDGSTMKVVLDQGEAGGVAAYVQGVTGEAGGKVGELELHIELSDFAANPPDGGTAPYYSDRIIAHEMVHAVMNRSVNMAGLSTWFKEGAAEFVHGADERVAGDLGTPNNANADALVGLLNGAWSGTSADYSAAYVGVRYMHETIKDSGGSDGFKMVMDYLKSNEGSTLDDALGDLNARGLAPWATEAEFLADFTGTDAGTDGRDFLLAMDLSNTDTGSIGGLDTDSGELRTAESTVPNSRDYNPQPLEFFELAWDERVDSSSGPSGMTRSFQVGANAGDQLTVSFGAASAASLSIDDIDLTVDSNKAIMQLDRALDYINGQRADYGAALSRLESRINVAEISMETSAAARSRIMDTDFAAETAQLTKAQILQQAGTAMLAQANSLPQQVLSLLQ